MEIYENMFYNPSPDEPEPDAVFQKMIDSKVLEGFKCLRHGVIKSGPVDTPVTYWAQLLPPLRVIAA